MKPYLKPFLSALLCICLPVTSFLRARELTLRLRRGQRYLFRRRRMPLCPILTVRAMPWEPA